MPPTEQLEIETKYDVDEHAILPALHELPGVASVAQPVELELGGCVLRHGRPGSRRREGDVARRTGGEDDGWHVKLPVSAGKRLEIQHPLGRAVRKVPIQVVRAVRVHVRDNELVPVVTLKTRRIVHRLLDADGEVLAELADDHVTAESEDSKPDSWREWEIELVNGEPELLEAAEALLRGGRCGAGVRTEQARAGARRPDTCC